MPFYNDEQLERRAREARLRLGIDDQIFPDMITVVFKLKNLGYIDSYLRVPDREASDEANFDPYEKRLSIRESVFSAANIGHPRARFTVAHEVGHIFLGHSKVRHRRPDYQANKPASSVVKNDETQANIFASAFLVPYHLSAVTGETTAEEIAHRFRVSLQVAEIRLPSLQRQYRIENRILRPLPASIVKYLEDNKGAGRKNK